MAFHSYNRQLHATNRARQRYHVDLSPAQLVRIGKHIRDGHADRLDANVYALNLHDVDDRLPDRRAIVAYSKNKDEVCTLLPDDWTPEGAADHRAATKRGRSKPVTSGLVPAKRDLTRMTKDELAEWRKHLRELTTKVTLPIDHAMLNTMLCSVNKVLKHLQKSTEKKIAKAKRQAESARIDAAIKAKREEKLQAMFQKMWLEDVSRDWLS